MRGLILTVVALLLAGLMAAVAEEPPLQLAPVAPPLQAWDAEIEPAGAGGSAAARLLLHNPASTTVVITGAESALARQVLLQHYVQRDGVTQIFPQPQVVLPGGHQLVFVPYGLEIRLLDILQPLRYGMDVPLTLRFDNGTTRTLRLVVAEPLEDGNDDLGGSQRFR